MADRQYGFPLPYTLDSWLLDIAVAELVQNHIWEKLSPPMWDKINTAMRQKQPLVVTKDDLDGLSDEAWAAIRHLLPGQP